jgi:hypothetical protein
MLAKPIKKKRIERYGVYRKNPKPIRTMPANKKKTPTGKEILKAMDSAIKQTNIYHPSKEYLLTPYFSGIAYISPELYEAVKERSKGICECSNPKCKRKALFVHHLVEGKRRISWLGNLLDLCDECHNKDGSREAIHHNADVYEREMLRLQNLYYSMGFNEQQVKFLLGTKSGRLF